MKSFSAMLISNKQFVKFVFSILDEFVETETTLGIWKKREKREEGWVEKSIEGKKKKKNDGGKKCRR